MVDSSTSVGAANFQKLEHFLKDVMTKVDIGANKVQMGVVKYGNYPSLEFSLNAHQTRPDALKAIETMTYLGGGTNDADAFTFTGNQVLSQYKGARGNVPRIAIMITDGGSANPQAAIAAADKLRQENVGIITVGVGNQVNQVELTNIADAPSSEYSFHVNSYGNLDSITDKLISQMCKVTKTQPPISTGPGATAPPDPCQDAETNCAQYGADVCTNYASWAQTHCSKFCGFCTPLVTAMPPKCEDQLPDCSNYGRDYCSQPGSYVAQNCQLFCGLCGNNTSSVGYYGQCFYKGKSYATGEKWYDGCEYECVCEDGSSGKYKCSNRCPVYHDLPGDCTLVGQPGECCLQPVCNFNPQINAQTSSGHGVDKNGIDVCVYKTKQYYQGQRWRDGCDYQCFCQDSSSGRYKCEDLCPKYSSIPPYCHLETPAGECCQKPMCEFDSQTGSFQGSGSISGNGVGTQPTAHPPCVDVLSSCSAYGKSVCVNYRGWAAQNCRRYCDLCPDELPKPGPSDRCVFGGKLYEQGNTWNTSCDTQCTCENAIYGYYRCVNTCPTYNNIPKGCTLVKAAGDCCSTVQCQSGYFYTSSTKPSTIGNGGSINVINPPSGMTQVRPTLPSGETPPPGTGGTGFVPPTLDGCLYKGKIYVQNQAWEDGCGLSCICTDAYTGLYSCKEKCPSYPNLAPSCHLVVDPNDECCKRPDCTPDPVTHQIPIQIPVFLPATQNHVGVAPPAYSQLISGQYTAEVTLYPPGITPAPPTVNPNNVHPGGVGYCTYNGQKYTQGQTWEDGCNFNCICDDASRGHYQCTEKCVHYPPLPPSCYMIKDPVNPCCDIPKCNFGVNYITHVGEVRTTTMRPAGEFCVYEGKPYQQGQTWYDGCSYQCTCEDAKENVYRCLTRCPEYANVDETCTFLPDPKDPSCCQMPSCPSFTTTNYNGPEPTPAPTGTFIGTGLGTGYCEYKGVHYSQGQAWQDGCDLSCVCSDSESGLYRCTENCPRYTNIPEYCVLVTDFANPCCKKPRCNFPPETSTMRGTATPPTGTTRPATPPPPGQTAAPTTGAPIKFCLYKGVTYNQGETWEDGCDYKCRCDNSDLGLYTCNERCASYDNAPATCRMVTDPSDSCCLVPVCSPEPGSTPAPVPGQSTTPYNVPTAPPGEVTGSANVPTPKTGETPAPLNYCIYKGVQYAQGQKWDDGCEYTCTCDNAMTGSYKCLEKCQKYVELPSNCRLARDPTNPCCQVPECGNPTPAPLYTPAPNPNPTTPQPNVCVYKGNYYTQGQQWYDACDYVCVCENSMEGTYTCNERCPHYAALPKECRLVPSSSDPLCCKEPKCEFVNTKNQTSGYLTPPTPPPGVIDGGVATPTPPPTLAPSPGYVPPSTTPGPKMCIYKGNMYTQGQKWQDGCDYNCECVDDMTGHYRCTEICSKYDDLPAGCRLITDPYNPCCKKAYCPAAVVPTPGPTPAPGLTLAPTPAPKTIGCMYNGVLFKQGETWNDGCDLQCVCEDQMTNVYRCRDRCNKYDAPEGCTLVTDPRDACCKMPYCPTPTTPAPWFPGMVPTPAPGFTYAPNMVPTPAPGSTYAPGKFPTWVPGMVPTPAPGFTFAPNKIPTPGPDRTYAPGLYPTWVPGMVPTPAPGMTFAPNKIPTPGPNGLYPEWIPGMVPTPMPGMTFAPNMIPTPAPGSTYKPGQFPTYVPGMVPTPAPGFTYAPNKIPTPYPGGTYAPLKYPTYVPGMVPTPAPGMTYAPWKIPTPAVGSTFAPGMYPTYVPGMVPTPAPGMTYAPNKIPTPAPGSTYKPGYFPTWVPGMVPTPAPGFTFAPNKIPTPAPGFTYSPGQFPTWVPGMAPTPAPGFTYPPYLMPTPAPGQTFAPGYFPSPSPQPTPAPGKTYAPYVPGQVPTPAPGMTYAPNLIPTPAPGSTYAPNMFPTYLPGMVPTPAPGVTFAPWLVPGITPAPGKTYAPFQYPTWVPGMVPTPAPGMTFAPNKIPTPGPDGRYPTWVPGMVPTPMPGMTFAPNMVPTPAPGSTYKPGQFPTYVPGMVPTPAPGVTYAPNMIPTPGPGLTYAPLKFPTWVPGMVPTPAPGMTFAPNKIPTPGPGYTYPPGQFPTWVPGMVPTPAPGVTYAPNMIPTPAPGSTYSPLQFPTYVPGMVPTPAPGVTYAPWKIPTPAPGSTYAPGKFPTWVPGMVPTPAPGITFAPNMIPTPAPGYTYSPGQFPTWVPGMVPTPAPGVTYAPNMIPTPAPGSTYSPLQFPTYVPGMVPTPAPGVTYAPWKIPTPAPGSTYAPGKFPTWLPGMIPTPAPGVTFAPNKIPTPAPGFTYSPGQFPTWVPGMVPTPAPGVTFAPNKIPTPAPGFTYSPGQFPTWVPGMAPTPAPGFTYPPYLVPTPAPGQTYAPGYFPSPSPQPTPAPGKTYAPYVPGQVPTPAPGMTYAPNIIPTPAPGSTYAPNMFPTFLPGMVPTPAPGVTFAPWLVPGITPAPGKTYAPFQYPTWVPGMVPTPAPGMTFAPNKIPTPGPDGRYPTWVPGMVPTPMPGMTFAQNMVPTPAPGSTYAPGYFPTYVPGMVPTPAPGVTYAPNMIPTPGPGRTYAPLQFPTYVPGMVPTPAPGQTYAPNKIPTPHPGSTYAPGMFPTYVPGMVPTPAPGMTYAPNKIPTPGPGLTFAPGQFPTYVPGMVPTPAPGQTFAPNMIPTPAPGSTYAPGMFPTYVPGMVPTPAPGVTYAPWKIPTPYPGGTFAPGMFPTYVPGMVPTPAPGMTYAPNKIPTPGPGLTFAPGQFPTYVPGMVPTPAPGQTYAPNMIPTPAPGSTYKPGQYPTYVPGMVPTPAPGVTYAPWKIPTPAPGSTYAPGKFPTWVPGMVPTPMPGMTFAPNMVPTPAPGVTYTPGQFPTWVPGMVPTPAPGVTFAPNMIPTPAPGSTYAPLQFPTWVPGMVPTPAPGSTYPPYLVPTPAPGVTYAPGFFPSPSPQPTPAPGQTYAPYVPGQVPTPAPGKTYAPNIIPTPGPGLTYAPNMFPTYLPGMVPTPAPGVTFAPWLVPGITPAVGKTYAPFQYPTWVPGMAPTPAPGSTFAPNKMPTPGPNGRYPTWVPGMVPTPMPGMTFAPNMVPTPAPGLTYAPGYFPTWVPGMVPTPAPGVTYAPGKIPTPAPGYTYAPLKFPTYVPGMVPTPAPGFTYAPNKIPTPYPGGTFAPGMFPTYVPGMAPTPAPGFTYAPNKIPTPAPGLTFAPGMYPTYVAGMVPTPAPGFTYAPNRIPTPGPGLTYAPGKYPTYVPGMVPTPAPGFTYAPNKIPTPAPGLTYAPGMYPTYVAGMVPTPAPGFTYAPDKIPTPAPGYTYAPGMYPTWVAGMIPTPAPGLTFPPYLVPTPAPGMTYAPGKFPTWVPGMAPTPAPGYTYAPNKLPTPAPYKTYAPWNYPAPTANPYPVPTAIPGKFQGVAVGVNGTGCVHYGVVYNAGQTWQDGCKYDCECLDDHTGRYQCKERCPLFMNIPTYCRLVVDPNDQCCKVPVCVTPAPTPTPGPKTNPTPTMTVVGVPGSTSGTNPPPTPQPKEGCVMNGVHYVAGQSWYDGCAQQCVCEDGMTGFYRCYDRCAKYPSVPTGCTLVPDPKDPTCCEVPQCIPVPGPGQTVPTDQPFTVTGVPGVVSGSGTPPTIVPGVGGFTNPPKNVCVYNGKMYTQGQKWQDGCKYECVCTDGMTGKYECTERCPTFPLVPPQCTMERDPNDICCFVPHCDYQKTTPLINLVSPSPGQPTNAPLPPSYCVYKGVAFQQGQIWDDGCTKKCRCDDADNNIYTCYDRCKSYNNLGSGCVMVSDPKDQCCQIPQCTYVPTPGPTVPGSPPPTFCPYPMPTAVPGVISGGPQTNPNTGVAPSNVGYCEYKGVQYKQGQSWDDGCSYTCSCIDSSSGQYQCQEKCPRYVGLPTYCKMADDPNNKCCKKPACNVCPQTTTPPTGTGPTPSAQPTPAPKEGCVMSGNTYTQGQKWYSGCDQICVCDDGKTGVYTCNQRCPTYQNNAGCTMVPDPRDPACCLTPKCPTDTGVFGTINGSGTPMPLLPGTNPPITGSGTPAPSPAPVCVYKGKSYAQGQRWQDGCQYECLCYDAPSGKYSCTDRCPRFPDLPPNCHLVYDPVDPCCQKKECLTVTPTPFPGMVTPAPTPAPSSNFCVYQGIPYRQDQTFNKGCDQVCKCEDAMTGKITCNDRCPSYPALTPNCTLTTDPNDQCCQIPVCTGPNGSVVGLPGTISGSNVPTTNNNPYTSGTKSGCVYNGQVYGQSQTWDDGCKFSCECLDATTGQYKCSEKCPRTPPLPSYCSLTQDPNNKCCQVPFCTPKTQTNPPPIGSTLTPTPPQPKVCVYKGSTYQQGQQWYDACDLVCTCDDASNNFYNCKQRCAKYSSIQPGCTLVPDPKDPTCCEIPSCPIVPQGPSPTPGIITLAPQPPGVITGGNPTPLPGSTLPPPYREGCVYKGHLFFQGQKFDDGCDYECECLSNMTGNYKCVEKCQKYGALPSECVLVQDVNKPCCQVPYCDFTNPTPFPTGMPVPQPIFPTSPPGVSTVAPYLVPGLPNTPPSYVNPSSTNMPPSPTPQPQGYCVYKGVYYTQGQTWDDGCDKLCRCEDVMRGYYTCSQRCPTYPPSSCPMKSDPNDRCCLMPDCNNAIPTPMTTPPPGQTTMVPTFTLKPVTGGTITGNNGGNPVYVPPMPGQSTSGSTPACVYKGMLYTQGMTWNDGCTFHCECVDASRGQYKCSERCPKYPELPPSCELRQSATDVCCKEPLCHNYIQPTTPAPQTVAPVTDKPIDKCKYFDGTLYSQGAKWQDGCSTECVCNNAALNQFNCDEKCPVYSGLPKICTLITDPAKPCCKKPLCTLVSGSTLSPIYGNATPPPKSLEVLPIGTHTVNSGYGKPATSPGMTGQRHECLYKGTIYQQGQSWNDGCDYVCTCENADKGMYKCTSKCPKYPTLPAYCKSVNVPGQCCPSVSCDIPGYGTYNPTPQLVPTPRPAGPTSNPLYIGSQTNPPTNGTTDQRCVYKGVMHNQGDIWDDGCDYRCQCQDGRTGYYVCTPLCPTYNNLPSNQCYLVKADGQCCSQPMCYDPNTSKVVNPLNSQSVFPVVGTYSGGFTGFRPNTSPGGNVGGSNTACVYKGHIYHQGDTWDDACDFTCACIDEKSGTYKCSAKCPTYTNIPPVCRLVDQSGSCCKRLTCNNDPNITLPPGTTILPPATTPKVDLKCRDRIDNCRSYGRVSCTNYPDWASRNCELYCGICTPSFTTPSHPCQDNLPDCKDYGNQSCSGIYEPWARDNCAQFCGYCPGATSAGPVITTPAVQTSCKDSLATCNLLDKEFYCKGEYFSWALTNCKSYCGYCDYTTTVATVPTTTHVTYPYELLLKGVAGAPGPDLYQLWHSGQTLNGGEPLASHLTSEYNGHYKPDTSNHWNNYCFDQIRVSIFNNGIEKAYILFNSTGSTKENWFTSDRIIDSSWTDLKTAQKEIMSLSGDANTGREFYISGHTSQQNKCDSFGWMMVSTKPSCYFEAGDAKPTFYYAPGTGQANWAINNPGTGDVFAIQGRPTCMGGAVSGQPTNHAHQTTIAPTCDYKGTHYHQGDMWTDGCNYNCSCVDASIGYYRCRDLCPKYTNLPPGCTVEKQPGDCCGQPTCAIGQVSTIAPIVIVGGTSFCRYKGQSYLQDQTWNDGCSQACTCTDATRGVYTCGNLCLNWDNLPAICHLEPPAPGLCCEQPRCSPAGVIINIPISYKDQYPGYNYVK
ncbi:uncharacterized protein LOC128242861 isoform X2 [Mya arenaria]|nr:uncharacterized protein LOC128242861 isoform X2 [Mya arenaria]